MVTKSTHPFEGLARWASTACVSEKQTTKESENNYTAFVGIPNQSRRVCTATRLAVGGVLVDKDATVRFIL